MILNYGVGTVLKISTLLVAGLLAVPASVSGQTHYPTSIAVQPDAPIRLDTCTQGTGIDAGNVEHLTQFVSFTNVAKQDVTAVEFRFDLVDTEDGSLGSLTGVFYGTYSPGAEIKPKTSIETTLPDRLASIRCSVYDARFADGTVWKAPTPAPSATSNP